MRTWLSLFTLAAFSMHSCSEPELLNVQVFQTSQSGDKLALRSLVIKPDCKALTTELFPEKTYQSIEGFGGAFTESTTYLLDQISEKNKAQILEAYFSDSGASYSMARTHINSCDFSLNNYAYDTISGDTQLAHFNVSRENKHTIPAIKQAIEIAGKPIKIVASPWTAPPWMKDNKDWKGGKLLPEYYQTWALYFTKYIKAFEKESIPIWAVSVENEPLGNNSNWESMHYSPSEMAGFVKNNLGPIFKKEGINSKILFYDQNKGPEMREWTDMYTDKELSKYVYGTAVHWYSSTVDYFEDDLRHHRNTAPDKHLIHTEACIDAEIPQWKNDDWYWQKEATDWGYDWAKPENKKFHPKYAPVYRYARDIIGCINNWVEGWIDWNLVLNKQGGPNWAKNWCIAPVIVDEVKDEVYYTPLYYALAQFSKFIKPGAQRIHWQTESNILEITAVKNPDNSIVLVVLNQSVEDFAHTVKLNNQEITLNAQKQSLQTILIEPERT